MPEVNIVADTKDQEVTKGSWKKNLETAFYLIMWFFLSERYK